jgi:hypothetical protein
VPPNLPLSGITVWSILKREINYCECKLMINNPRTRRATAVIMMLLGAILMFLAPKVWWGVLLLALGIALELVGIALERRSK